MKTQFTFCLLFAFCLNAVITTKAQVNRNDSLALVDLYKSTDGLHWKNNTNWLTGPVKDWYGIDVREYRVTGIGLDNNNLKGNIPAGLGNLKKLVAMDLSYNKLSGSIPNELGSLLNLRAIVLDYNKLSGAIPSELGNLSHLFLLTLSNNQLTGIIPRELGKLPFSGGIIGNLDLSNNHLTGNIPPELGNIAFNADWGCILNLSHNQLSGNIPPELGELSFYAEYAPNSLNLSYNQLSGSIPPELGNLSFYTEAGGNILDLSHNQLSGNIPSGFANISGVSFLRLSHNQLSGKIPPELCTALNYISLYDGAFMDLSYNQLSGTIPPEFGNISFPMSLDLSNNRLSGNISAALFNTGFQLLKLSYNKLTGSIPVEIGNAAFNELYLDHNQLSGAIPSSIANLKKDTYFDLYSLDLSYNRFTFDGMELVAQTFPFAKYNRQAPVPLHLNNNTFSVSAGGTLSNNTYVWYKKDTPGNTTISGDSVFHPTESGTYFVKVQNAIAKDLKLVSRAIKYTAPVSADAVASNKQWDLLNNSFSVYPNPAKNILHVITKGNASFSLISEDGKTLVTTNINKAGVINISNVAAGVYYLKNNNTNASKKIAVIK